MVMQTKHQIEAVKSWEPNNVLALIWIRLFPTYGHSIRCWCVGNMKLIKQLKNKIKKLVKKNDIQTTSAWKFPRRTSSYWASMQFTARQPGIRVSTSSHTTHLINDLEGVRRANIPPCVCRRRPQLLRVTCRHRSPATCQYHISSPHVHGRTHSCQVQKCLSSFCASAIKITRL